MKSSPYNLVYHEEPSEVSRVLTISCTTRNGVKLSPYNPVYREGPSEAESLQSNGFPRSTLSRRLSRFDSADDVELFTRAIQCRVTAETVRPALAIDRAYR